MSKGGTPRMGIGCGRSLTEELHLDGEVKVLCGEGDIDKQVKEVTIRLWRDGSEESKKKKKKSI